MRQKRRRQPQFPFSLDEARHELAEGMTQTQWRSAIADASRWAKIRQRIGLDNSSLLRVVALAEAYVDYMGVMKGGCDGLTADED